MIVVIHAQPIAKIVPERQTRLLAGLHQAGHGVERLSAIAADRSIRDLPLDDKPAKILFRCVRIQRRLRPLGNSQQLGLAALQPRQQLIEVAISGADGEYPIEPAPRPIMDKIIRSFSPLPFARRSFAFDRGKDFAGFSA